MENQAIRPRSLQVALAMLWVMVGLTVLGGVMGRIQGYRSGIPEIVELLIRCSFLGGGIWGLMRRKQWAWRWCRRLSWSFGVLLAVICILVVTDTSEHAEGPFLPMVVGSFSASVPNLLLAISLGRRSARAHFHIPASFEDNSPSSRVNPFP